MNKRLVGGVFLLCLTAMTLTLSEDGETYTNITQPEILEQLTNLKTFISNPKMIKPVWIQLKNGDQIVVVQGELKVVDTGEFEICVKLNGYKLIISIEFTQATLSDDTPIDDWYIAENDAKYLFTSDAQNVKATIEDADFGDVALAGDLSVTGDISGDAITGNSIIENMNGYSFDATGRSESVTYEDVYAGVVKNGNKLTFVCALNVTSAEYPNEFRIGKFIIPSDVLAKLYPTSIGGYNFLAYLQVSAIQSDAISVIKTIAMYVSKQNDGIEINSLLNDLTDTKTYYVRIELTFLLSDNLIPQP